MKVLTVFCFFINVVSNNGGKTCADPDQRIRDPVKSGPFFCWSQNCLKGLRS